MSRPVPSPPPAGGPPAASRSGAGDRPVVPGYRLVGLLGSGGSARVWRAVEEHTGDDVALKVTALHDGADATAARAEAALLTAFDHPHLLRLRAMVEVEAADPGRRPVALVLDLAAGGSLADLLRRRGRLAPGEVVTALAPVAAALAHVHDEGLVHGDVTPGNVLFRGDGAPVLADLGVSRVLGAYGDVRTTPAYADPSVAAGGRPVPASDVFMLAATAVHALTGVPPWPDPLPGAALARAARGDLGPVLDTLAGLPAALRAVLGEALRPEPHLRPSAAAVALDLRHAVTPVPVDLAAGRTPRSGRAAWTARPVPTGRRETHRAETDAPVAPPPAAGRGRGRRSRRPAPSSGGRPTPPPRPVGRHATPPPPAAPGGRRPVLAVLSVLAGVVALAAAVVGLVDARGTGRHPRPAAAATAAAPGATLAAAPSPAPSRWTDVLAALDGARAAAYAHRDPAALAHVYAPGELLDGDRAELARVVPPGCGLAGARTRYTDVTPARADPSGADATGADPVVLTVRATLAPSTLRCPGRPDVPVAGVGVTTLRITLVAAPDGGRRISGQRPA